jgi:hypothetical protein
MPTSVAPRRKRRQNRAARRAQAKANPPDNAKQPAGYVVVSPTVDAPPPDLETLPAGLLKSREMAFAECMKYRMEGWLAHFIAARGIPADACAVGFLLLPIYVEAYLKACILFPELLPRDEPDDDEPDEPVITAGDVHRAGLTVIRKRPGKHKPVPTLPGCRGIVAGLECGELRRYGERFCPSCMRAERERKREEAQ